jgi:hypothetical protein
VKYTCETSEEIRLHYTAFLFKGNKKRNAVNDQTYFLHFFLQFIFVFHGCLFVFVCTLVYDANGTMGTCKTVVKKQLHIIHTGKNLYSELMFYLHFQLNSISHTELSTLSVLTISVNV